MLKFLLDVGVGKGVERYLLSVGFDVVSVLDLDPTLPDSHILDLAESDHRMVVTMDKDFGELVFHSKRKHNGVLLLRLEDADGEEKAAVMRAIIQGFASEMEGRYCVFKNGRLRIR